ncbi:MAG: hypothetical protein PWQ37_1438 [Candidatus Petromonas sp.]|jgi:hypothetical protein|nr:hypothetical protein [Candidatus Petromonas sp.]
MNKFRYEIISGTSPVYIEKYFKLISDTWDDNQRYYGKGWEVKIEYKEPRSFGNIYIPVTKIIFMGDKKICQRIIKDFRMKFLSAGG